MSLIEAVKTHEVKRVRQVLWNDPDAVKKEGKEALFLSAREGDFPVLKYLVEYSAVNLSDRDEQYNSALYYGVRSGNLEVIRYLTERGGLNPMEANYQGQTPFDLAHESKNQKAESYFEEILGVSYEDTYHNPILAGCYPDPSIVRVGEDYYMVNSSFCNFPCIPISHSRDLVHWEVIGHGITRPEYAHLEGMESGRGYWAADISYYEGRFYIAATYRLNEVKGPRRKQIITSSERPEGPYDEPVFIEEDGIDPSLFADDDGRRYMLLNRGARILELSRDGKKKISEAELLWYGCCKKTSEGPHLLKKDGYYYLFQAEGGTGSGHRINVSRSKTLKGRYQPSPYNPLIRQTVENAPVQCCGHGKLVQTQYGDWYLVYLCLRKNSGGYGILGRETALEPITWTADGWPVANAGQGPSSQQIRPKLPKWSGDRVNQIQRAGMNRISFTDPEWVTPRCPCQGIKKPGEETLTLTGTGEDLNSLACRSLLLRRQKAFDFTVECEMKLPESLGEGEDLGLTCYYDENSYLKCGFACRDERLGVLLAEYVGDGYVRESFLPITAEKGEPVSFKVETESLVRRCYYRIEKGGPWSLAGICEHTEYLSSEGLKRGKRFTGAMFGVYVHGALDGVFYSVKTLHS